MARNLKIIGLTFFVVALIWLVVGLAFDLRPRESVINTSVGLMIGAGLGYLILKAMTHGRTGKW